MRACAAIFIAILAFCACSHAALAEKRVALVVGNSAYQNVVGLTNPVHDAAAITTMFQKAGFDVVESRHDLKNAEMRRAMRYFTDKARDSDIAVIYYAGHGIEVNGVNYLVPVDAMLERDTDAYDEAISLDRILQAIEPAKRLHLVILDACRNNPFLKKMTRTVASRSMDRGLIGVEPNGQNTLIAYAAKAGFTAMDGDGQNSPFALALLKHLTTPGLDLRRSLGLVRDDVLAATANKQEPYYTGSLGGEDMALVPALPAPVAAPVAAKSDVRGDYELAERVGTKDGWDSFITAYPSGFYADLAKAQRNKLAAETARLAATDRARAATEEKARLAAEGAKASEQARAAAEAKAAEDARLAAEKKKQAEEAKVALAAQANAAAQAKAAEKAAAEKPRDQVIAALPPPDQASPGHSPNAAVRTEAGRVQRWRNQRRMERAVTTGAGFLQQERRDEIRHQARKPRCARCGARQDRAGLPARMRSRLSRDRRPLRQDHLRRRTGAGIERRLSRQAGTATCGRAPARKPASGGGGKCFAFQGTRVCQ